MNPNKPRIIKDYEKLDPDIQERIKLEYPNGYSDSLIYFTNKEGKRVSALPFETEDKYYLVRMTVFEAERIIEEDDDFDSTGSLKSSVKEEYESKYADDDFLVAEDAEDIPDDDYEEEDYNKEDKEGEDEEDED
jgi:hypothetical protein